MASSSSQIVGQGPTASSQIVEQGPTASSEIVGPTASSQIVEQGPKASSEIVGQGPKASSTSEFAGKKGLGCKYLLFKSEDPPRTLQMNCSGGGLTLTALVSQFARSSPRPLALPDGGKIVGSIALSSSDFVATNNGVHLVEQDQSSSTASDYERKNRRETSDKQGITVCLCSVEGLQLQFGCKHKDAVKSRGVRVPMFKSTCRQHQVYWWLCSFKNYEQQAIYATNNSAQLVKADQTSPTVSNAEKGCTIEALKIDCLINVHSLADLQQHIGARRKDSAKGLGVC